MLLPETKSNMVSTEREKAHKQISLQLMNFLMNQFFRSFSYLFADDFKF